MRALSKKEKDKAIELMDTRQLTHDQSQELVTLAEELNEKLRAAASSSAERAFGIGCSIGLIPVAILGVVLYSLHILNLILAVLVGILAIMFLIGTASFLSSIARSNTLKRTYQDEIDPEIVRFTARYGISRQQFDTLASSVLADDAPMQSFLKPLPAEPAEGTVVDENQVVR